MSSFCLISGIALLVGAIIFCYRPVIPAALLSYAAMWTLSYGNYIPMLKDTLMFWGIATMIVLIISSSSPQTVRDNIGVGYIATGTLTGCVLGMLTFKGGIIIGAAIGAALGLSAFCRTPKGSHIKLPSKAFISQLAAKGLPTIVAMSIFGTTLDSLLHSLSIK